MFFTSANIYSVALKGSHRRAFYKHKKCTVGEKEMESALIEAEKSTYYEITILYSDHSVYL